jgi:hypothetical protein
MHCDSPSHSLAWLVFARSSCPCMRIDHYSATMSMSGFSIRRLILRRRAENSDAAADSESDDGFRATNTTSGGMQKESWFTMRRNQGRKRPPTPIFITKPQGILHNASTSLLPPPTETSGSSTSSLCSFERHGSSSIEGRRRSTLWSISSKNEGSELSLQISSTTSYDGNESSPLPTNHDKQSRRLPSLLNFSSSRLDLGEALSLNPQDKEEDTSRPESVLSAMVNGLANSIKDLADEDDEAFQTNGINLTEADAVRTSFNETPELPPRLPVRKSHIRTSFKPKLQKRHQVSRSAPQISPSNSLRRTASVKTIKRKKSTRSRQMKAQRKPLGVKPAAKNSSKWTENVSDLLSGKLFHKIEADEMLTPEQIEAYKLRRLSKLQTPSATTSSTNLSPDAEAADTPVEPFHMDDLPSRIGSSGVELTADTPTSDRQLTQLSSEAIQKDLSMDRNNNSDGLFLVENTLRSSGIVCTVPTENLHLDRDIISDQPVQMKSPNRYILRKVPELPTISESTAQDEDCFAARGSSDSYNGTTQEDDTFYLSTPYTMTAPCYRHGRIRLAKPDLSPDRKLAADDGLDWTAFQMAILGGAGDYFADSERNVRRQEAEDAEKICAWWDEWGFAGCGNLTTRDNQPTPRDSVGSTASGGSCSSCNSDPDNVRLYHEIGRDNPYSARHRWQSLRHKAASEGRKLDLDLIGGGGSRIGDRLYSNGRIKMWNADGHGGDLVGQRESLASMPQSPMLDLRVVTSDNGDVDFVPMGYNLSHDLGDFLSWETENVYSDNTLYDGGVI